MTAVILVLTILAEIDWIDLARKLWQGFQMIGGVLIAAIRGFVGLFGISVPDWTVELATIIVLLIIVLRYGKFLGKILLVILLLILASTLVQLFI